MSTAPRYPEYAGLRLNAEQYQALGETEDRYELINGVVMMSPSPKPLHWEIVQEILVQILAACPDARTFSEIDIFFDDHNVYRPDLAVYAPGRLPRNPPRLDIPPDLIVEVVSRGSRALDLVTKRDDYERFGVGEYWTIDPDNDQIRRHARTASGNYAPTDELTCATIPSVKIDADRITRLWRDA